MLPERALTYEELYGAPMSLAEDNGGSDSVRDSLLGALRNGAWLDAQDFPPLRYAVPGIVPEGLALFVGAPKIGKSWATLGVALGLASGGVAFGRVPTGEARPVLLCALEDGHKRLQDRCRKLLLGDPIPRLFDFLTHIEPGAVVATINEWFDLHPEGTAILDTLGKVMPPAMPGESAYQRDYRIGSTLKRVVDSHPGSTLIVIHHDRKAGSDDFIDAVSGTHGLAGAADTTIVLARNRHESAGLIKVTGRDVPENEYAVRVLDGIAWQLDGHDLEDASRRATEVRASATLGDRSIDVLGYVNAHPEGVTPQQVADALQLPDARQYLLRLSRSERIVKRGRGSYLPLSQASPLSQPPLTCDTSDGSDTPTGGMQ